MADFFWFSDTQWARIEPLLPTDVRGKPRVDDRRVLSGIVLALRCAGKLRGLDQGGDDGTMVAATVGAYPSGGSRLAVEVKERS